MIGQASVERAPLICDPQQDFLKSLRIDPLAVSLPPVLASEEKAAGEILLDETRLLSSVFVNPKLSNPGGIQLVKNARQRYPNAPIFFIVDEPIRDYTHGDIKALTVHEVLEKPLSYGRIIKAVKMAQLRYQPSAKANSSSDALGGVIETKDAEFVPILASNFISGNSSFFDLYVRLGAGKYTKILAAGDVFDSDRLQNYRQKGLVHFYLRAAAQERYLQYCDHLTTLLLSRPGASTEAKTQATLNQGQEVANFMRHAGVSEKSVLYAEKYVRNVQQLVRDMDMDRYEPVRKYLAEAGKYEHNVGITMIAALLAEQLQFETEKSIGIIGLACFLHDVGLQGAGEKFLKEEVDEMTEEEINAYHTHPTVGADILQTIPGIDPVVIQAVAQHHERRGRNGFPNRLGPGSINRIAEIIGISEEFFRLIQESQTVAGVDPLKLMEARVFNGFSGAVIAAFQRAFGEPSSG